VESTGQRGWLRRHRGAVVASALVAGGFFWLMHAGGLPVVPSRADLAAIRWWAVGLQVLLYLVALQLRAHRWKWLLDPIHPVPLRQVLIVSYIGYGALVLLPFRTGEAVRPLMIRKKGSLSAWAATGSVAAERIVDGVVLSLVLLCGLWVAHPREPLPDRIGDFRVPASIVPGAAYTALVGFGIALAIMTGFYLFRERARELTRTCVGWISPRAASWLADVVSRTAAGLGFLPRPRYSIPFLLATLGYFAANVVGVALLIWAVGLGPVDIARASVVVGVLHIGVLLPNAPGYFGAFQLSVYAALALYYAPVEISGRGSAMVFLLYATQIGLAIATGLVALAVARTSLSRVLASEGESLADDPARE